MFKVLFCTLFALLTGANVYAQSMTNVNSKNIEELASGRNTPPTQEHFQEKWPSEKTASEHFFMTGNMGAGLYVSKRGFAKLAPIPTYEVLAGYSFNPRLSLGLSYQLQNEMTMIWNALTNYRYTTLYFSNHIVALKGMFSFGRKNFSSGGSLQPFLGLGTGATWWTIKNRRDYNRYRIAQVGTNPRFKNRIFGQWGIIIADAGFNFGSGRLTGSLGCRANIFGIYREAQIVPYCGVKFAF